MHHRHWAGSLILLVALVGCAKPVRFGLEAAGVSRLDAPEVSGNLTPADSGFSFSDDWVAVKINPSRGAFAVELANLGDETIRVLWDEAAYTGPSGAASRVVPGQTRAIDANRPVVPAVIPPDAHLSSIVMPLDHWVQDGYQRWEDFVTGCDLESEVEGRALSLVVPISRGTARRDYRFSFRLTNVEIPQMSPDRHRMYCARE